MGRPSSRQQRDAERAARKRRRILMPLLIIGGIIAVLGGLYLAIRLSSPEPMGEEVPLQDGIHIEIGETHEPYSSDPPTSGPHYGPPRDETMGAAPVPAGFYEDVVEDEYLIHDLEHGYVIVWYDCTKVDDCEALKTQVRDVVSGEFKVVGMPREGMETAIALTSWGRLLRLDTFNQRTILNFIQRNRGQAPEPNAP